MSITVNMHEAKTHFSKLVERALSGEEVIIAKAGKPVIRFTPVDAAPRVRRWGMDKGRVVVHDDFDDPIPDWEEYF